jgi:hypothetical protein
MVPSVLSDRVFFPSLFLMEPLGKPALSSNLPTVLSLLTCLVMFLPPFLIFIMLANNETLLLFSFQSLGKPDNQENDSDNE